ncbi:hypothetical protein ACEPPN_005220 [Leptodophora sp. 'Broadleaf-Isolate-01']
MIFVRLLAVAMLLSLRMADTPPKISFYRLEIHTQAPITKFESTLVIPAVTPDTDPQSVQGPAFNVAWLGARTCVLLALERAVELGFTHREYG